MTDHDYLTQPAGAPDQKVRVLEWLRTEPGGLTQLQALQELAVARLAAVVYRLREDGHVITTELVELPTRYGPAVVARYHLSPPTPSQPPLRVPVRERPALFDCGECVSPVMGCAGGCARATMPPPSPPPGQQPLKLTQADFDRMREEMQGG